MYANRGHLDENIPPAKMLLTIFGTLFLTAFLRFHTDAL